MGMEVSGAAEALRLLAGRQPSQPAVVGCDGSVGFRHLDQLVDRVAGWLVGRLGPGRHRVGVCVASELGAIAAGLGAARAAKIAVPLDPAFPPGLLRAMAHDASLSLVVTDMVGALRSVAPTALLDEALAAPRPPRDMFPGGAGATGAAASTGRLAYTGSSRRSIRALVVPEASVLRWRDALVGSGLVGPGRRCGLLASGSAPVGNERTTAVVLAGATAVPFDIALRGAGALPAFLRQQGVETLMAPPSLLRRLALVLFGRGGEERRALPVSGVLLTDEPVTERDVRLARWLFGDQVTVGGFYAPPEVGVVASGLGVAGAEPPAGAELPAGWCEPDVEVRLVDGRGNPVEEGGQGEIAVWGEELPAAWWARPGWTERTWFTDPQGRRWCRTGDQGRWDTRGRLVVISGPEGTVWVRGQRVEVAELEEALTAVDGLVSAEVSVVTDDLGSPHLTVSAVASPAPPWPAEPVAMDSALLREELGSRLGPALVPDEIHVQPPAAVPLPLPAAPRVIDLPALEAAPDRPAAEGRELLGPALAPAEPAPAPVEAGEGAGPEEEEPAAAAEEGVRRPGPSLLDGASFHSSRRPVPAAPPAAGDRDAPAGEQQTLFPAAV